MKKILILLLVIISFNAVRADEGMWMLPLVEKLNIQKMNGMGCVLTAEEIYSENQTSLKDAVIVFGRGCTGVMVSNQGLLFTNHHCGYGAIQQLSKVEHNYLRDGFTAEQLSDELYCKGLTVKFLVRVEDVTQRVIDELPFDLLGKKRIEKQDSILNAIKKEAEEGNKYIVDVKSFYSGNEFYMFVMEEFTDVRLAYTPPSSIGKFGGDTDNWMWPRHTGDFAVFRVYSDADGKPAKYSKNNVPYAPKRFAKVSTRGYHEGDYAMIMGNPGSTNRYVSSWGVNHRKLASNMARIDIRGVKQDVWRKYMLADEAINIAYANKFAGSSNYWKNSIGMNAAIDKLKIIERKQAEEREFAAWVNANAARKARYGKVLNDLEENYAAIFPYSKSASFLTEALLSGNEMPRIASTIETLSKRITDTDSLITRAKTYYENYSETVDESTFVEMLKAYRQHVDADALPTFYQTIDKKFKGNYEKFARNLYAKSAFTNASTMEKALRNKKFKFDNDPAIVLYNEVLTTRRSFNSDTYTAAMEKIRDAERKYEAGLLEMNAEKGINLYPDANFTMRLTYGTISGYEPADAVTYSHYSTTKGILEKEKPGDFEFDVPAKLKEAIVKRDFANYIDTKTGELHVGFLSNNDITGGNSGSPIFNGKGELIGLAFDGNWEAMSGDIVFEPDLQRTINVDIRYVLFVMDKVGNAQRLIKELSIEK